MVIISLTLEEMNIISIITAPAPVQEAATRIQFPNPLKLSGEMVEEKPSITKATPRLAPELIPRTYGPAMGLRKTVCICNPLNDNATPTIRAVIAFGNLNFKIMVSKSLSVLVKMAFNTSEAFMLTEPKKISSIKKLTRINRRTAKTTLLYCPDLRIPDVSICVLIFNESEINIFCGRKTVNYQKTARDAKLRRCLSE